MHVVFDAYWWQRGPKSLQNVLHGVINAWAREFPGDRITLIVRKGDVRAIDQVTKSRFDIVETGVWPQALSAAIVTPMIARKRGADCVLTQNFAPLLGRSRNVLIHDLLFETNPEWFTFAERIYFKFMTILARRRASKIIATSSTEAARIRVVVPGRPVIPVGLGVDDRYFTQVIEPPPFDLAGGAYILSVGRLNARKNLKTALDGARLSGMIGPQFPMVVAGSADGAVEEMPDWLPLAEREGSVIFTGHVSDSDLVSLVKNCALFVFMSHDEGYGLPPVEAACCGVPVLVSDIPIFRETLNDYAHFANPSDPRSVAAAITQVLGQPGAPDDGRVIDVRRNASWDGVARRLRHALVPSGGSL